MLFSHAIVKRVQTVYFCIFIPCFLSCYCTTMTHSPSSTKSSSYALDLFPNSRPFIFKVITFFLSIWLFTLALKDAIVFHIFKKTNVLLIPYPSGYSPITVKLLQRMVHVYFLSLLFSHSFLPFNSATYQFTGTKLVKVSNDLPLVKLWGQVQFSFHLPYQQFSPSLTTFPLKHLLHFASGTQMSFGSFSIRLTTPLSPLLIVLISPTLHT